MPFPLRRDCLENVNRAFALWHSLDDTCRSHLYAFDHRWHENAMRLEEDDAVAFCKDACLESVLDDTFPEVMSVEILAAVDSLDRRHCHSGVSGTREYADVEASSLSIA